jgi:hypothetical protein
VVADVQSVVVARSWRGGLCAGFVTVCAPSGNERGFALLSKDTHNGDVAAARGAGLSSARQFAGRQRGSGAKNRACNRKAAGMAGIRLDSERIWKIVAAKGVA